MTLGDAAGDDAGALATEAESRAAETGELRLLAAVLRCAIDDAREGRRDALAWIASDAAGRSLTGWCYVDVCAVLALDPSWARAQVVQRDRVRRRRGARRVRMLRAA